MSQWDWALGESVGDPVIGEPGEFDDAAEFWGRAQDRADDVYRAFERIKTGDNLGCHGLSMQEFAELVDDFDQPLDRLAKVCGDVEHVLSRHSRRLDALRVSADSALARAVERRERLNALLVDADGFASQRSRLSSQIEGLNDDAPPDEKTRLTGDMSDIQADQLANERNINAVQDELDESRQDWRDLHQDEEDLCRDTCRDIEDIELGKLRDPGLLQRILAHGPNVLGMAMEVFEEIAEALDWDETIGDFLWAFDDALSKVGAVLAVIGVALLVVGAIVTSPVWATVVAVAIAVVAVVGLVVAIAKFATSSTLYSTQWDNKKGERKSGGDVALDAVGAVLAAFGAASAVSGLKNIWATKGALSEAQAVADGKAAFARVKVAESWSGGSRRAPDLVANPHATGLDDFLGPNPFHQAAREATDARIAADEAVHAVNRASGAHRDAIFNAARPGWTDGVTSAFDVYDSRNALADGARAGVGAGLRGGRALVGEGFDVAQSLRSSIDRQLFQLLVQPRGLHVPAIPVFRPMPAMMN